MLQSLVASKNKGIYKSSSSTLLDRVCCENSCEGNSTVGGRGGIRQSMEEIKTAQSPESDKADSIGGIENNVPQGFRFSSDSEIDETRSKEVLDQFRSMRGSAPSGDVGSMALIDKKTYIEGRNKVVIEVYKTYSLNPSQSIFHAVHVRHCDGNIVSSKFEPLGTGADGSSSIQKHLNKVDHELREANFILESAIPKNRYLDENSRPKSASESSSKSSEKDLESNQAENISIYPDGALRSTGHRDSILSSDSLMETIELSPPGLSDELWQPEPFGLSKPQNVNPGIGSYDSLVNELPPSPPMKEMDDKFLHGHLSDLYPEPAEYQIPALQDPKLLHLLESEMGWHRNHNFYGFNYERGLYGTNEVDSYSFEGLLNNQRSSMSSRDQLEPPAAEASKRQRLDESGFEGLSHGQHYFRNSGFGLSEQQQQQQSRSNTAGNPMDYGKHSSSEPRALGPNSQLPIPKEWMTESMKAQQNDMYVNVGRKNWNSPVRFANSPRTSTCSSSLEGYSQGHSQSPTDPSLLSCLSRRPTVQRSRKTRAISDAPQAGNEDLHINENLSDLHDSSAQSPTKKIKISRETVREHVHLPIQEAAKLIGVCPTVLKKQCRQLGIRRWPYRKIQSITNALEKLREQLNSSVSENSSAVNEDGQETFKQEILSKISFLERELELQKNGAHSLPCGKQFYRSFLQNKSRSTTSTNSYLSTQLPLHEQFSNTRPKGMNISTFPKSSRSAISKSPPQDSGNLLLRD